jgi:hypothetical protein
MVAWSLDAILNFVVPVSIFIFLGAVVYGHSKESIDKALLTVKGWFIKNPEEAVDDSEGESILTYK